MEKEYLFESTDQYFLRKVRNILERILKKPQILKEETQKVEELVGCVSRELSYYCYGILEELKVIFYEETSWKNKKRLIIRNIDICSILLEPPSEKVFEKLVKREYQGLWIDNRFSDEFFKRMILKLIGRQNYYETCLFGATEQEKREYYQKLQDRNDILWIAVCRMINANEEILLKVIRNAKIGWNRFYQFCVEIASAENTTEEVLIALIEKIQKQSFDMFSRTGTRALKTRCVFLIFQLNSRTISTAKVAKVAIELITPAESYYYEFYHMLIWRYRNEEEILELIQETVEHKRLLPKRNLVPEIKRLQLLINNLLPLRVKSS